MEFESQHRSLRRGKPSENRHTYGLEFIVRFKSPVLPSIWTDGNAHSITNYNVIISVLSMFILLVKGILYVVHIFPPILSLFVHAGLAALYAVSIYGQAGKDMSDPKHPQPGAPWYITKSCSVAGTRAVRDFCQQAKGSFAVAVMMWYACPLFLLWFHMRWDLDAELYL